MKFTEALDRKLEDIKRPPNPPVGHYIWQVSKHPDIDEFESSRTGGTFERITFQITAVSAGEDVDTDDLQEYGNVAGYTSRKTFLFSSSEDDKAAFERSMFNLRRFLGHCGVSDNLSLSEALAASVGQQFMGELTHRPDPNDPEIIYAEVGRTAEV
jgi:hypothetical protein